MNTDAVLAPDLSEARRLLGQGMHLVQLHHHQKRPIGNDWNAPDKQAKVIKEGATGYGLPLALNSLCSVDPDHWQLAQRGMRALGFDLNVIMDSGVRTSSTRPGSGGRSAFREAPNLSWLSFRVHDGDKKITVIEFRADSPNLQDCIPGVVYVAKDGSICTQTYANGNRLDAPPGLPDDLREWWQRCSTDIDFLHEQERNFAEALDLTPTLSISTGKTVTVLAYGAKGFRVPYNASHSVEEILERHGYVWDSDARRWAPATATGVPGVRPIPGKDGLWRSDHASDPLMGTFDAWIAHVVLDHGGDLEAAKAQEAARQSARVIADFTPGEADTIAAISQVPNIRSIQDALGESLQLEYVVQHILVRGWLYALTANPGSGKTAVSLLMTVMLAMGRPFMGRKTVPCKVLFLCGENPQDVRIRTEVMLLEMGIAIKEVKDRIYFTRRPFAIDDPLGLSKFLHEVKEYGPFDLMIIDTGPAHSKAEDENDNRAMHDLAMSMRVLMGPLGAPCTIALMHPVKNATRDNLLPRGGSSFTGSIDGALCLWREGPSSPSELFPHKDKFRGQHFPSMWFDLEQAAHPSARDNFGDAVFTVVAKPGHSPNTGHSLDDTTILLGGLREKLLTFIAAVEDAGDWVGNSNNGPNANNPFRKSWTSHPAYPPCLLSADDTTKRFTFREVEELIKEGLLVRETRQVKPKQRQRDWPTGIWLTAKGRAQIATEGQRLERIDDIPAPGGALAGVSEQGTGIDIGGEGGQA